MWRNRTGYAAMIIAGAVLFFLSGQPMIACMTIGLVVLAVLMGVLLKRDALKIHLELALPESAQEGKELKILLKPQIRGRLWVTQKLAAKMQVTNRMFGTTETYPVSVLLSAGQEEYEIPFLMEHCGLLEYELGNIWVQDLFGLFRVKADALPVRRCTCYPRRMPVRVETSPKTIGETQMEGIMQNKKGNDRSEVFDIREYAPGDDVRAIHWKLSSKTDSLILREASDPSHYRVAVLADYGVEDWEKTDRETKEKEWDTVIAAGAAICRELAARGETFCMIFPAADGIKVCEIENRQENMRMLAQWMGMPMRKEQGTGFRFFMNQHLEQQFSRLVILSAGRYEQSIEGADNKIGITIVCAEAKAEELRSSRISADCVMIEIPVKDTDGIYRIMC